MKPDIENRIKEGSIEAYFNSEMVEITAESVTFKTPTGIKKINADFVFAMTGYHPDFKFLRDLQVQLEDDELLTPLFDAVTYQTNRQGLYLAGVVCGGMETSRLLIENSREHSQAIFDDIMRSLKQS